MKTDYYLTKDGVLKRKHDTVYFVRKDENGQLEKRILPVEQINAIFAHGSISFSSGVVSYLSKNGVPIHFFGYYDNYIGSFWPRETLVSGELLVKQVEHYSSMEKRMLLAKSIVRGLVENIITNLEYYQREGRDLSGLILAIKGVLQGLEKAGGIKEVLNVEGRSWDLYYSAFDQIFPESFRFEKRSRQPPENMLNCLISFGNMMLYSTTLTEIYNTQLNPTISYLHEPSERRFSLALDISEIFRPVIVDRVIFKIVNKRMIDETHFVKELNSCLLNDRGRRLFIENYEERLRTTIKHRSLGRSVSYRHLIRLECYKLVKHLLGMGEYTPLTMWW